MGNIQLRDVNKSFGAVNIIPKINLDINDGEFVVFGWFSQKQLVQGLTFGAVK